MLFRKYQVIVLSPSHDKQRSFFMRLVWLLLACILFMVLAAGNYAFWQYYKATQSLPEQLASAQARIESQRTQLLSLAQKAQHIQDDLARVQKFDASLRLMLDVKTEVPMLVHMDNLGNVNVSEEKDDAQTENAKTDDIHGMENVEHAMPISGMQGHDLLRTLEFSDAVCLGLDTLPLHRQELLARKIHAFFNDLATATQLEEVHQQELIVAVRNQQDILAATPSIWPTKGKLTSPFGWRSSPTSGASTFHKGIDIGRNNGAPIVAPASGTVTFAGRQSGYGNCIELRHANGITTFYAHMQNYTVKLGQNVKRNDVLGYVGNTGRSTGPHLHYEVRVNGVPVDPMKYILN